VILPVREEGLACERLYRDGLTLALPEQHTLASTRTVEISDLDRLPLVVLRGDIELKLHEGDKCRTALAVATKIASWANQGVLWSTLAPDKSPERMVLANAVHGIDAIVHHHIDSWTKQLNSQQALRQIL